MATRLNASHLHFPPLELKLSHQKTHPWQDHLIAPPQWARAARGGSLGGQDVLPEPNGTLRCRQGATLSPQERRPEHDGTGRVVYAARIADCRSCPRRTPCQGHGSSTNKPRRVSAVLHPLPQRRPEEQPPSCLSARVSHPVLWGDWSRSQPRRDWIRWQRSHLVTVEAAPVPPASSSPPSTFSRAKPGALADDAATTAHTQEATTRRPTCRDYCLWDLNGICPRAGVADRLSCCTPLTTFILDLNTLVERAHLPLFVILFPMDHTFCLARSLFFALFPSFTLSSLRPDDRSKGRPPHFSDRLLVSRCVSRG